MKIKYTIPSKTFLLGEYSVLFGGDAILMATKPLFEIIVDTDKIANDADMIDFSQGRDDILFRNTCDGFGKSSAGFLALYNSTYNDFEIKKIVRLYKGLSKSKINPSCADIVSQIIGFLTFFDGSLVENSCQLDWLFYDVEIMIFKTNTKITTYKHLSENINICMRMLNIDKVYRYTYKNIEYTISLSQINYIQRDGRRTKIVTKKKEYFQNISISNIKDILPNYFKVSSKGTLINMKNISKIDWNTCKVYFKDNTSEYVVSKSHKKELCNYECD